MEHLIHGVRKAVDSEAWYAALGLALALPDVCGYVDDPTQTSKARYSEWFDREVAPKYCVERRDGSSEQFLSGADCYALRCAFLHQGDFDIQAQRAREVVERFLFAAPPPNMHIHNNRMNQALQLQVSQFCEDVCSSAERWVLCARADRQKAQRIAELPTIAIYVPGQPYRI